MCACLMNIFVLALGEIAPAQRWTPCFWFFVYFEFYFALKKCHHFCKLLIDFSVMPPGTLLQTLVAKIRTFLESWIADPKGIAKVLYFLLALWAKVWFSFNSIGHGASILIGKSTTSSKAIFTRFAKMNHAMHIFRQSFWKKFIFAEFRYFLLKKR